MEDRVTERVTPTCIDVIWIILRTGVGFALIRIFTSAIKIFPGVYGDLFSVALFTGWMFGCMRGWAKAEGYTLAECRCTRFALSWKDVMFVVGFLAVRNLLISLTVEEISYTGLSLLDIIPASMTKILRSGIGSGFNEELVFRGYLMKSLEDKIGITKAVIASSLVFGVGHLINGGMTPRMMVWVVIGTGSLGAMFAVLTYNTGSIWRAVLAHACCNLSTMVVGFEHKYTFVRMKLPETATNESVFCMSYALSAAMCFVVIGYYCLKQKHMKAY